MAIPTILQGDDTAAHGRTLRIILPDGDYTGVEFRLDICGMSREWMSPADGWLEFALGADDTRLMPLGTHSGRLRVRGADGVTYTLSNAVRIRVTDCPAEAYGADAQTIDLDLGRGGGGGLPDLTGINGNPATPNELAAAWREFMARLRGAAGGLLLALVASATLAGGLNVHKAASGDLPWGAEVVTNVTGGAEGAARPLPRYLHLIDFDDSYPDEAAWYYAQPQDYGHCSAVRDGNELCRNYDWSFDDAAEFVVRVSAGGNRHASVGIANVGTNLTESFVTSGKPSRYYKCLPGRTVDGINEQGVVAEVNVVNGPVTGWQTGGDLHPLAAVRWVLDNADSAEAAAEYLADNIRFPDGWTQNFHWMVADSTATYIVENGAAHEVTGRAVMTNFRLFPSRDTTGAGQERYDILMDPASNITNAWYTRAYLRTTDWASEFRDAAEMEAAKSAWETHSRETLRDNGLWQTVHTSVYDLADKTLHVAVQEEYDWYSFSVPVTASVVSVNGQTGAVVLAASDVGALRAANGTASVSLSANGTLSVMPDGQHGVHIHSGGISGYASDGTVYTLDFPATGGDTIALKSQVDEKADTADLGTAAYADADGFAQLNGDEQQDFAVSQLTVVNGIDASACDIETVAITAAGESGEHTLHSYRWEYRPEAYLDGDREISVKEDLLDGTYPLVTKSGASVTLDNHRRNLVTVSGAVSLSVNWASHADFDAVLYLDIQSGGTVNWSGVTSGMTVMQPKGNGALQYEAGKKYIVGLTKIGTSSIALSKQELEAAQ